jgi:hypothetical protein
VLSRNFVAFGVMVLAGSWLVVDAHAADKPARKGPRTLDEKLDDAEKLQGDKRQFGILTRTDEPENQQPVPDEEQRKEIGEQIRKLYKEEFARARTPAQKSKLAFELLKKGIDSKRDLASQYVLLDEARTLASSAGNAEVAIDAFEELAETFEIDVFAVGAETLSTVASKAKGTDAEERILESARALIDRALRKDEFPAAERLASVALIAARKMRNTEMVKEVGEINGEIKSMRDQFAKVESARQKLEATPDDPEASTLMGRYYCFNRGDWPRGLPLLAAGDDAALKSLAKRELADPEDATGEVAVGDGWWDIAEKLPARHRRITRLHAAEWYENARAGLSGLTRARVEKRLAELQ